VRFYRHGLEPESPLYATEELDGLIPADHRQGYDIREVLARLVDGSLFHEFLPHRGKEVITGVARISGLWVGIAGNISEPFSGPDGRSRPGGILYREGIAKLSTFSRACDADGIPLFWLQDVAGFDIGLEAETQGLLGYGSSLIYSNSTTRAPVFTVLLCKASGAGYYAMHGLPYEPIVQLSSPLARLAVMEGRTLAIAAFNTRLDDDFEIASTDPEERAKIAAGMADTAARIEADMDPVKAASQMDTDEVIRLREIRSWCVALAEMAYQSIGHRRIKNPRIWSLHDLEVLCTGLQPMAAQDAQAEAPSEPAHAPEEGLIAIRAPMEGSFWSRPRPGEAPFVSRAEQLEPGQTLGLIEVMKTFSPIRASEPGQLVSWVVEDGEGVRAGQVMGWLRPL
jgi:acetyl-CoA carboxylase carboxyltransferase component